MSAQILKGPTDRNAIHLPCQLGMPRQVLRIDQQPPSCLHPFGHTSPGTLQHLFQRLPLDAELLRQQLLYRLNLACNILGIHHIAI